MTGSEREVHVEERANRILSDDRVAAVYAAFVEAQLRYRRIRNLLAGLSKLTRIFMIAAVAFLSAGIFFSPVSSPPPAEEAVPGSGVSIHGVSATGLPRHAGGLGSLKF